MFQVPLPGADRNRVVPSGRSTGPAGDERMRAGPQSFERSSGIEASLFVRGYKALFTALSAVIMTIILRSGQAFSPQLSRRLNGLFAAKLTSGCDNIHNTTNSAPAASPPTQVRIRLRRLPLTWRLFLFQRSGLCEASTVAVAANEQGELGEAASATCQEASGTDQGEFGETASAAGEEASGAD